MKNISRVISMIIGGLLISTSVFGDFENDISKNEVESRINSCIEKQDSNREEDTFICIIGNAEEIGYQVIIDHRFTEIDKEIEKFIFDLEKNKGQYFGKDKQGNYIEAVQDIIDRFGLTGEYGKQYYEVCNGLQSKLLEVFPDGINISNTAKYFPKKPGESTACTQLADIKLSIYKQVSYNVLLLNKLQVSKDEKKLLVQQQRSKYDVLVSKFFVNIGYVEKIWAKWPSKTRITSGGG